MSVFCKSIALVITTKRKYSKYTNRQKSNPNTYKPAVKKKKEI